MSLKKKIILVCAISLLICAVSVVVVGFNIYNLEKENTAKLAHENIGELTFTCNVIDNAYTSKNQSSMLLLQKMLEASGSAHIVPEEISTLGGEEIPALYYGTYKTNEDFSIVDELTRIQGGTATVFARKGNTYWRVASNVKKPDGSRAIGTVLNPKGKAYAAIQNKEAFYGLVNILGRPYLTGYEPIFNMAKDVVGITYVGVPLTALDDLRTKVAAAKILTNGFYVLLDGSGEVVFQSDNAPADKAEVQNIIAGNDDAWGTEERVYEAWGYRFVAAYSNADIMAVAAGQIFSVATIFGGVLVVVLVILFVSAMKLGAQIQKASTALNEVSATIFSSSSEVMQACEQVANAASSQAASVEETSAAVEEITSLNRSNLDKANSTKDVMGQTQSSVQQGNSDLQSLLHTVESIERLSSELQAAMGRIQSSSQSIGQVITTIDEISFQTNLLALNAAVEAARAGEAGAGFAVVADEVRSLAGRSAKAAGQTSEMITEATESSDTGVRTAQEVQLSLGEIREKAEKMRVSLGSLVSQADQGVQNMDMLTSSTNEQTSGMEQISQAISSIDQSTQSSAASAEETAAAAREMAGLSDELKKVVSSLESIINGKKS